MWYFVSRTPHWVPACGGKLHSPRTERCQMLLPPPTHAARCHPLSVAEQSKPCNSPDEVLRQVLLEASSRTRLSSLSPGLPGSHCRHLPLGNSWASEAVSRVRHTNRRRPGAGAPRWMLAKWGLWLGESLLLLYLSSRCGGAKFPICAANTWLHTPYIADALCDDVGLKGTGNLNAPRLCLG